MTQRAAEPSRWTYDEYARLPDDGVRYEVLKPPRYAELGVPEYWLADPEARVVEVLVRPGGRESPVVLTDVLEWQPDAGAAALHIDVPALFAGW